MLKPVDLLILTMLSAGERHGYGIRQDIIDHTGGAVQLEAGNLYRSIGRLIDDGLVDESGRRPAAARDDERRRYYRLSPAGRRALAAELVRLRAVIRFAESRKPATPERA